MTEANRASANPQRGLGSPALCTPAMVAAGRSLAQPLLSPDGRSVAFVASAAGSATIVVVDLGGEAIAVPGPEVVISVDPPVSGCHPSGGGAFCWHPDSQEIVYAARDGGLYLAPAHGGPGRIVVRPPSGASCIAPACSPDGVWLAFVVETPEAQQIAIAPLPRPITPGSSAGERAVDPIMVATGASADFRIDPSWGISAGGDLLLAWHEWSTPDMPWDASRIACVTVSGKTVGALMISAPTIWSGGYGVSVGQPQFAPSGDLAYVGDESGWKVVRVAAEPRSNRAVVDERFEHADPTWGIGQRSFCWSPDGRSLAFCRNEGGFGRLCVVAADGRAAVSDLGRGIHLGPSWSVTEEGHERIAAIRSGGRTPTQLVVYEPSSGNRSVVARGPVGGWESLDTPEPTALEWRADDGEILHARLYAPTGAHRPPMLVLVHGGPTSQTGVAFSPRIAYWLSNGWAVLVPDHRGSTGWGRAYQQSMNERWGVIDSLDCASAVRHVFEREACDPRRVVAMGGSAGGFTVLHLLAAYPELFAAGVDLFGVTDLLDLDETTHRYERTYNRSLIGPRPEADAAYRDRSPVNFADQIHAPLLVLHGDADDSVVIGQSRALVDRMRAAGRTVELHEYTGEGHGWRRPETIVDELNRIDAFLERHLGPL